MGQFAGLLIFLILLAFLLRVDFIFYIFYVCLGVFLWIRWYTPRAFRRLVAERLYNRHAFWGETVAVSLRLHNTGRWALPWVQITESVAPELRLGPRPTAVVTLKGGETTTLSYRIKAARRGYYKLGPSGVSSGDLFGLMPDLTGFVSGDALTVYPRIIPLSRLGLPSRLPFGTVASNQRLFADPARPMGVRDYRSGDSLRQINWKVSAHRRELMVRTHEPAISLETAVLLNLHVPDYGRRDRAHYVEWAIEVAASLCTHLIDRRQPVGLLTNGSDPLLGQDDHASLAFDEASGRLLPAPDAGNDALRYRLPPPIPPRNGRAHLMKVLERLARIEATTSVSLPVWAPTACMNLSWGITILAVTPRGDEQTCYSLHRLVRVGFNPVLIAVEPDYNFGRTRFLARQLGFAAYRVSRQADLDRWRQPDSVRS